jgi:hypothetical protein
MRSWRNLALSATALVLALSLGPAIAEAQQLVKIRLEAPADHPGFGVFDVTLLKEGAIVNEGSQTIIVSGGRASLALTVSVTDVPDEVALDFAIPSDGLLTLYTVAPLDFEFDRMYFLPEPSPGGEVVPQAGDPATDAFFLLSLVEFDIPDDQTPPTCDITQPAPGEIEATLQDVESGLEEVEVRRARNLTVDVPAFTPGTTDPVTILATVDEENRTSVLALKAADGAGNRVACKRVQRRRRRSRP